jgi:hypothetical protein
MTRRLTHCAHHTVYFPEGIQSPLTGKQVTQITLSDEHFYELVEKAKREGMSVREYVRTVINSNECLFPQDKIEAAISWLLYKANQKRKEAK